MAIRAPIERPGLTRRIAGAVEHGHVLVVAPAGAGKTTAVRQALAAGPGPVAWVACRGGEGAAGRLALALVAAVRDAAPGVADVLADELTRTGAVVAPARAVAGLREEVERLLVEPLVLVVDDAERLGDDAAALSVLEALVDPPGDRLRVVLCARRRPALKLARLEATGALTTFAAGDLVLGPAECGAVLERRLGREPTEPEIAEVMEATGGWALGVALGGRGGDQLVAYVAEEVLDPLTAAERLAVLDSSVVDDLSPAVATALGFDAGVVDTLDALGMARAPGGGARSWHPLVRAALHERWEAERAADARAEVLGRAAHGLREDGRDAEAVDLLLRAGREDEALVALVPTLAHVVRLAPDAVGGWLEALTPAARSSPAARLAEAELAMAAGRHAEAVGTLEDATAGLRAQGAVDGADRALALLLECLYWAGRFDDIEAAAGPALEPESLGERPHALLASVWAAAGRGCRGDVTGMRSLADAIAAHPAADWARQRLALLALYDGMPAGDHDAAIGKLGRALGDLREDGRAHTRPEHFLSFIAFLLVDSGRAAEARGLTAGVRAEVERSGLTVFIGAMAAILEAWIAVHEEDWEGAELALASLGGREPDVWGTALASAARVQVEAARGRRAAAHEHAERALARAATAPVQWRAMTVLAVIPALEAAGERSRALAICASMLAEAGTVFAGEDASRYVRARLIAQRAWLRDLEGEADAAALDAAEAIRTAGRAATALLRAEWGRLAGPAWNALAAGAVEPDAVVGPLAAALPGADALLALAAHPLAPVRAAVAARLGATGDPRALSTIAALAGDADPDVARAAGAVLADAQVRPAARRFTLLGGFVLHRGEWRLDEREWGRPTVSRLVRFLLVHRAAPVPEDVILEALWPEHQPDKARSALRVAVSRARQVLDPPDAAESVLRFADRTYRLVLSERDQVDTEAFAAAAEGALGAKGPDRPALLRAAAARWTGEPLPEDLYAEWARDWRDGLRERYGRVLAELVRAERRTGDERAVTEAARKLVDLDPLDEDANRTLIVAYARTGRRALALRQFLACRRALVDGLGLEPAQDTVELQSLVLAGRAV